MHRHHCGLQSRQNTFLAQQHPLLAHDNLGQLKHMTSVLPVLEIVRAGNAYIAIVLLHFEMNLPDRLWMYELTGLT